MTHAQHDHDHGHHMPDAETAPMPPIHVPAAVSFDTVQHGTNKGDLLTAGAVFRADLQTLNGSGVTGMVEVARDGDALTVRVKAEGLEPDQVHIQHIHGRVGADGTARESNTPGAVFDTDGDGFVELAEGLPSYGPILLDLTNPQGAGLEGFPTAPDGTIDFEMTYDLSSTAGFGMGMDAADLSPLDLREFVVHGLSNDGTAGAGTTGEIDGTAGYKLVLPVASGEFIAEGSRLNGGKGEDTLLGGRGEDTLLGGAGADSASGAEGDDVLKGGAGADTLQGDAGFDRLEGGAGADLLFGGTQGDYVSGGAGDDTLHGDAGLAVAAGADTGADRLVGGAGDDVIWFGDGLDVANGGSGKDTFGFRFDAPVTPLAAGTGPAFATIEDFSHAEDTLLFDVAGKGEDAVGASFADSDGTFYSGAAAGSAGERVMVLTDQGFANGGLAVQAAQGEQGGDFVVYFNTTVNAASLLVVSAPDTAASIARFTDITSLEDFQAAGLSSSDFVFA